MTQDVSQKEEFLGGEGNGWFQRNRAALARPSPVRERFAQRVAAHLSGPAAKVLEVGAGQGTNLAALGAISPIEAHGLEPSAEAVAAGRREHAQLDLRRGTADQLPYEDEAFDLVWFGFCLYLVDRRLLFRCVAEADRVLRPGGLLALVDFDPDVPCRRSYSHRAGVWSYKMDYAGLFLANPEYRLLEKQSASHAGIGWVVDPQERIALWICRKDSASAYRSA